MFLQLARCGPHEVGLYIYIYIYVYIYMNIYIYVCVCIYTKFMYTMTCILTYPLERTTVFHAIQTWFLYKRNDLHKKNT